MPKVPSMPKQLADMVDPVFNNAQGVQATQLYIDILRKNKVTNPAATTFKEPESSTVAARGLALEQLLAFGEKRERAVLEGKGASAVGDADANAIAGDGGHIDDDGGSSRSEDGRIC